MDLLHNIAIGFSSVLTPENLMYSFIGVFLGNVVGVLPGVGPLAAISMVLPCAKCRVRPERRTA